MYIYTYIGHGNLDESIILIYSAASNVGSAVDAAALLVSIYGYMLMYMYIYVYIYI
jgi:hypothetical protein